MKVKGGESSWVSAPKVKLNTKQSGHQMCPPTRDSLLEALPANSLRKTTGMGKKKIGKTRVKCSNSATEELRWAGSAQLASWSASGSLPTPRLSVVP